ncbi:MAG: transposase [Candidatus Omnitrophota bacterium]
MPRQGRIHIEGGIYHVIQRGIERREIFKDDEDREEFLKRLEEGLRYTRDKCYGWVLMPNHFHLVIRTSLMPLSDLMRRLLTGYALYFNKRHKRSGYLYQGRYKSILCQEDAYLLELIRYVHLNPLRAGMVKEVSGLRGYKWSGHVELVGSNKWEWQSTEDIWGLFGKRKNKAIKSYEEFIIEGVGNVRKGEFSGGGLIRSIGGWKEAEKFRREKWLQEADERILGDGDFVSQTLQEAEEKMERREKLKQDGWDIERVIQKVCKLMDVSSGEIKRESRRSRVAQAKSVAVYLANKELGIRGSELAEYFEITRASISASIQRGKKIVEDNEYLII